MTLGNVTFRAVYESPVFPEGTAGPESEIAVAPRADELSGQSLLETTPLSDIATAPAASNTPKAPIIEVTGNIAAGSGSAGAKTEADSDLENRDYRSSEPDAQRVDESTGSSVPVKPSVDYDTNDAAIVIDDVDALSPERSIAIQNLDQLPASTAPVSFVGSLNVDDAHSAASAIDAEAIQLDGPAHAAPVEPDQSGLGSFLKKLPR